MTKPIRENIYWEFPGGTLLTELIDLTIKRSEDKKRIEGEIASEETKDEVPGQASTTPDPKYQDAQYMTKDIAGGINKAKKTYPKVSDGDNPMAVKERLISEYQMFKNKTEPRGTVVTDDMINQKSTK